MASRTRGHTRGSRWLLGAALFAVALVFALVPGVSFAANPAANLDQCQNGSDLATANSGCNTAATDWVNGNLGSSKSAYREGDSIPYRLTFSNLSTSGSHAVTIEWDTTKGGKHALDYIDTVNASVTDANPCLGVSGCSSFTTFPIPKDPQVDNGSGSPVAQAPGVFRLYGGTITSVTHPSTATISSCTAANVSGSYCYETGTGFSGDKSAAITINFTASVASPVLAWGGHISTRKDWGNANSAVSVSGSPYHTRLLDLDGSGGNQDRSLSAAAVIFPGFIHIVKQSNGGTDTFGFTASPAPLSNFSLNTATNNPAEKDFDNITTFQTYTVSENTPPTDWTLSGLACQVASSNGGTFSTDLPSRTATINMAEGEQYTCTYTNNFAARRTLSITKSDDLNPAHYDHVGQVITYTITATNTGNVPQSITVSDTPALDGFGCTPANGSSIAPSGTITCTGTHTVTQADLNAGTFGDNACADATGATEACAPDTVTGAPLNVSQITPTQTTCSQFAGGTSPTLTNIFYSVSKGKVQQNVNPGVMFYWVKVTATAGSNTFTITQTRSETSNAFTVSSGSSAFTAGCTSVGTTITQAANGAVTVTFNASSAGTYIIGIKYNPKAVAGETAPSPNTTVVYTFATNGVAGSTSSVNLVKQ